jgi:hypothetical protein
MKVFKTIVGVTLILFGTITVIQLSREESGAGLTGVLTGYSILMIISIWLIYSANKKNGKQDNRNLKNESNQKVYKDEQSIAKSSFEEQKESLDILKDKGLLNEPEYLKKLHLVEEKISLEELHESSEYSSLKVLFDGGLLTKAEFDEKTKLLRLKLKENPNVEVNGEFRVISDFKNGLALAVDNNLNYGFVDLDNNIAIDFNYEYAECFCDDLALVRMEGKFGFIGYDGQVAIPFMYDDATSFVNGKAKVEHNGFVKYINKKGQNTS